MTSHLMMFLCCQVDVTKQAYHQAEMMDEAEDLDSPDDDEETANPRDVGHNIYILAHQVCWSRHSHWGVGGGCER